MTSNPAVAKGSLFASRSWRSHIHLRPGSDPAWRAIARRRRSHQEKPTRLSHSGSHRFGAAGAVRLSPALDGPLGT